MSDASVYTLCPYCGGRVPSQATICPDCNEDLAALVHLEYEHAIAYNQALALAREGEYEEAVSKALLAVDLEPEFRPGYLVLAKLYVQLGRWEAAEQITGEALARFPGDADLRGFADDLQDLILTERNERKAQNVASVRARRENAEAYVNMYERDVKRAFGLGAAVAGGLALLIGLIGGRRHQD